jgi:uncharacterized protein (DUF433 family)
MPDTTHNTGSLGDLRSSHRDGTIGAGLSARSWIEKTPGVCGGSACIRTTRITVWGLVEWKQKGLSDARLFESIVGLTPDDLRAAWDYYATNQAEIDDEIKSNEEA